MKTWFTSLSGAITISAIALITEVWRGYLDAMFVFPVDFNGETLMNMAAVIFTLLFSAWAGSLYSASKGSRGGLIIAFVLNGLVLLAIPIGWLLFYCPADCRAVAGIFNLANTINLLFGLLAAAALGLQFRKATQRKVEHT